MTTKQVVESATCHDCNWAAHGEGARRAAGTHHHATGHRLTTEATTTYGRVSPQQIPGQTNIYDELQERAA